MAYIVILISFQTIYSINYDLSNMDLLQKVTFKQTTARISIHNRSLLGRLAHHVVLAVQFHLLSPKGKEIKIANKLTSRDTAKGQKIERTFTFLPLGPIFPLREIGAPSPYKHIGNFPLTMMRGLKSFLIQSNIPLLQQGLFLPFSQRNLEFPKCSRRKQ